MCVTDQLMQEQKELFLTQVNHNGGNFLRSRDIFHKEVKATQSLGCLNKKIIQVPTENDYFDKLPITPGAKFFISATNYHNPLKELKILIPATLLYNGGTSYFLKSSHI